MVRLIFEIAIFFSNIWFVQIIIKRPSWNPLTNLFAQIPAVNKLRNQLLHIVYQKLYFGKTCIENRGFKKFCNFSIHITISNHGQCMILIVSMTFPCFTLQPLSSSISLMNCIYSQYKFVLCIYFFSTMWVI